MSAVESRTVLVVDDDPEARASLRELLADASYDVVEARNGREALNYLTSDEAEPALIVTDLEMPQMSGWELVTVLQGYARLATLPVLVVSARDLQARPTREEGVLEFFVKPLDTRRFLKAVDRHALSVTQRSARKKAASKAKTDPLF